MEKIIFNEAWALEFYRKGWSDAHIEKELGLPPRTIGNWRRRNGLPSNYPSGWAALSKEERQQIIRRRQAEYQAEKDAKLRARMEAEKQKAVLCRKCRYRGILAGTTDIMCDFAWITGRCRTAMPKREDGQCPAFDEGEPIQREVIFMERPIKIVRQRSMRFSHELMLALYMEGKSDSEIGTAAGCDKSTVYAWRHRNQLPANEHVNEPKYDGAKFRELYDRKLSDNKIARECGCTESTVSRWRHSNGLPAWGHGMKMDPVKARELYDQGLSDLLIANALGCGETTIGRWRAGQGLPSQREKKRGNK